MITTKHTETMEDFDAVAPYEPLYEYIKTDELVVWEYYQKKILSLVGWLGWQKSFDSSELTQQAYLYFHTLCQQYDPYYNGHFFPFDRYLFKNLITKLRAYIQRYYVKAKREKPSEYCEYLLRDKTTEDVKQAESDMYLEYIYSLLAPRPREVLKLMLNGFTQQEIGRKLNISQSRVSVIKKKALRDLYIYLDDKHTSEEKREFRINAIKQKILEMETKNRDK